MFKYLKFYFDNIFNTSFDNKSIKNLNKKKKKNYLYILKLKRLIWLSEKTKNINFNIALQHIFWINWIILWQYSIFETLFEIKIGVRIPLEDDKNYYYPTLINHSLWLDEVMGSVNLNFAYFWGLYWFILHFSYYFFYYKKKKFYLKKSELLSYKKQKYDYFVKAYGRLFTILYYFEQEKLILNLRIKRLLYEKQLIICEQIIEKFFIEFNKKERPWESLLSENENNFTPDMEEKYLLYTNNLVHCFFKLAKKKKLTNIQISIFKHYLLNSKIVIDFFPEYYKLLATAYIDIVKITNYRITLLKYLYEEAYYTKVSNLEELKQKFGIDWLHKKEMFYYIQLQKNENLKNKNLKKKNIILELWQHKDN